MCEIKKNTIDDFDTQLQVEDFIAYPEGYEYEDDDYEEYMSAVPFPNEN